MNARSAVPLGTFLLGLVTLAGLPAGAADSGQKKNSPVSDQPMVQREYVNGEAQQPMSYEALLKKYDLNHDGKLDEDEIKAMQAQLKPAKPAFSDTNRVHYGDKITRAELVNVPVPGTKGGKDDDFFRKYDLNGDGVLDAEELAAAKADLARQPARSSQTRPAGAQTETAPDPAPVVLMPDPAAAKSGKVRLVDPTRPKDARIR